MTVVDQLEQDHTLHRNLLTRLVHARGHKARDKVVMNLERALVLHMRFEEEILFPTVLPKADEQVHEEMLEARAEHDIARATLRELLTTRDPEMWRVWAKVLKEELEHHMDEEEKDLFPKLRHLIGDAGAALADVYARWRAEDAWAAKAPKALERRLKVVGLM